jgi:hypothetical protein
MAAAAGAHGATTIFTVTATTGLHSLNPLTYLTAYLDTRGHNKGKPPEGPDLERFLPRHASSDDLTAWKQPQPTDRRPHDPNGVTPSDTTPRHAPHASRREIHRPRHRRAKKSITP